MWVWLPIAVARQEEHSMGRECYCELGNARRTLRIGAKAREKRMGGNANKAEIGVM